jgi:hypothetical protein
MTEVIRMGEGVFQLRNGRRRLAAPEKLFLQDSGELVADE